MRRIWCMALLGLCGLGSGLAQAAPVADPLDRPALKLRDVRRSLLLNAVLAGSRLVAVGEHGSVALSDDNGGSWRQAQRVPVSVTLTAVHFVNERIGWATGHAGVLLRTDDGGETWIRQLDGVMLAQIALRDAQALAARLGHDSVEAAQALREAGQLVKDGADKPLLDLAFNDERQGIVVGAYNLIFATTDGGKTWQSWMHRTGNVKALHLYALARLGDEIAIAGEQGLLLRSSDAGQSFARVSLPYQGSWFGLALLPDRSLIVAGLKGQAYRLGAQGEAPVRLSGGVHGSFVGVVRGAAQTTWLATQSGQLFSLTGQETQLRVLSSSSLPPLTGLLALSDRQLLALTVHGAQRVVLPGAPK